MSSNGNSSEEVEGFYSVFNAISAPQGVVLDRFFFFFFVPKHSKKSNSYTFIGNTEKVFISLLILWIISLSL
jgi:hypothetical protein